MTQEQIEKALEEHIDRELSDAVNCGDPIYEADVHMAFREGAQLVNKYWREKTKWIPIEERVPPIGVEVLFQNDKWIEERNPKGVRIGFLGDRNIYYSAYYSTFFYEYFTRDSVNDVGSSPNDKLPTKWKEID